MTYDGVSEFGVINIDRVKHLKLVPADEFSYWIEADGIRLECGAYSQTEGRKILARIGRTPYDPNELFNDA